MPAETHQRGIATGSDEVCSLLCALMGEGGRDVGEEATLASFGVDEAALGDLWDVVREEFGERSLGPTDREEELDSAMTIAEAASVMARLLARERGSDAG